jgi:hypothetical protein
MGDWSSRIIYVGFLSGKGKGISWRLCTYGKTKQHPWRWATDRKGLKHSWREAADRDSFPDGRQPTGIVSLMAGRKLTRKVIPNGWGHQEPIHDSIPSGKVDFPYQFFPDGSSLMVTVTDGLPWQFWYFSWRKGPSQKKFTGVVSWSGGEMNQGRNGQVLQWQQPSSHHFCYYKQARKRRVNEEKEECMHKHYYGIGFYCWPITVGF